MIAIIDTGLSNIGAVANMLKKVGAQTQIVSDPEKLKDASRIILPGVGSFQKACEKIDPFRSALKKKVIDEKVPALGICLGMQILCEASEEGSGAGLSWIPGSYRHFDRSLGKVPHMGWNFIEKKSDSPIFASLPENSKFYFVHSYYLEEANPYSALTTTYRGFRFTSCVLRDNILGVQFHPEKSHKFGLELMKNFTEWKP